MQRLERLEARRAGRRLRRPGAGAAAGERGAARTSRGTRGTPSRPSHLSRPPTTQRRPRSSISTELRSLWPAVVDQLRQGGSELLSHVLEAARPVAVDIEEAVLEVGFPPAAAFNKRKAEASEARDRFAEAVKTIVGERLRPVFVLLDGDERGSGRGEADRGRADRAMQTEFDAEEIRSRARAGEAEPKEMTG